MTSKNPRKKTYLGWKVHGRIVARFALYWALYNCILWQLLCARDFLQSESSVLEGKQGISLGERLQSIGRDNAWIVAVAAIVFPMLLWEIVRLTHRVIGPLKRLEGVLNRMVDGETIREVKFRDGDLIESFEKTFNRYLASLQTAGATATAAAASACENVHPSGPPTSVAGLPESESMHRDELASLLHDFRKTSATVTPIRPGDSASGSARSDRDTPLSMPV
jgi:hypothetical protein